jgi:two-component system sensor histidine kinase VicK
MEIQKKPYDQESDQESSKRRYVLAGAATLYRSIMENSLIPLCLVNLQGEIFDLSHAVTNVLKCSREELLGKKISDYFDFGADKDLKIQEQLLDKGTYTEEIRIKTTGDQIKDVKFTVSCLQEELYLVCFRDVTERRENEHFKDKFIYIVSHVSHELRRPLATIGACLDLLQASFHEKSKKMERFNSEDLKLEQELNFAKDLQRLNTATNSVEQMAALINNLLDLTRMDLGKMILNKQKFMLDELLRAVAEDMQLISPDKRILLLCAEKEGDLTVKADPLRIREVIENLLSNAANYSPSGGVITVTSVKKGANALVSVRDQGLGIALEDQPQVFERFYMTPKAKQLGLAGLGLGLHITKQLIELHKGRVWLKSKEGEGSTFYFTLPLLLPEKS